MDKVNSRIPSLSLGFLIVQLGYPDVDIAIFNITIGAVILTTVA